MSIFALFEDGTAGELLIAFYCPDKPIDIFMINQDNRQIEASARRGATSAYHILRNKGILKEEERYLVSFELQGEKLDFNVLGESAGLAFSLKFTQELYRRGKERPLPFSVAATGRISDATAGAEVKGIKGINEKLQAAAGVLKKGDKIFCPKENDREIDEETKAEIERRQIEVIPVSTVKEAIEKLLEGEIQPVRSSVKRNRRSIITRIIVALIIMVVLSIVVPYGLDMYKGRQYHRLQYLVTSGEFKKAAKIVKGYPDDPMFVELAGRLNKELTFNKMKCYYYLTQPNLGDSISLEKGANNHSVIKLTSDHNYKFEVEPASNCYLYIYQVDSSGRPYLLFPDPEYSLSKNPLTAGTSCWIPSEKIGFYDQEEGRKKVYIVASYWPARDLEALSLQTEENQEQDRLFEKLQNRLRARNLPEAKASFYRIFYLEGK
ncbi:DUF4384 domain-containing protein [bacterium]|nr:DUF4384 domain-containing protein [bacterium]MBU1615679.1 DUF4384 domain-containing protein [bacterium]